MRTAAAARQILAIGLLTLAACGDDALDPEGTLDLAECEQRDDNARCVCDRPTSARMDQGFLGQPGEDACDPTQRCIVEPAAARGACFPTQDLCLPDRYQVVSGRKELASKDCSGGEVCLVLSQGAWFGRCETPTEPTDTNKGDEGDAGDDGKGGTDLPGGMDGGMDAGMDAGLDAGSTGGSDLDASSSDAGTPGSDASSSSDAALAADAGVTSAPIVSATLTVLPPPGTDYRCTGTAISLDGTVVVGQCTPVDASTPSSVYTWKNAAAPSELALLEAQTGGCSATAMSGDGKVVAGLCSKQTQDGVVDVPVIWNQGGSPQVVSFPWSGESLASMRIGAMNDDGTLKAAYGGSSTSAPTSVYIESGFTYIFPSTSSAEQSTVTDMSSDGTVVAGVKYSADFPTLHVYLWSKADGASEPINLELFGNTVLSGDGKVVYGNNNANGHGFRWTSAGGVESLISLGEPKGTNENGAIVVAKSGTDALVLDHGTLLALATLLTAGGETDELITPEFVALSSSGMRALANGYISGALDRAAVIQFATE